MARNKFYNLPPSWNPGYAIPDYVMAEPPERGTFTTQWLPRGTIPTLVPEFYADPGKELLGRRDAGLGSLGGGCFDSNSLAGSTLGGGSSLAGDSLGAREYELRPNALGGAARAAKRLIASVKHLPPGRRGAAMKSAMNRIDPALHARATAMAGRARARGARPAAAAEYGITSALASIGKSSAALQLRSLRGLGGNRGMAALGALPGSKALPDFSNQVSCSADGQFVFADGAWRRLKANEICTVKSGGGAGSGTGSGGGITVVDTTCAAPGASQYMMGMIPLSPTDKTWVDYTWICRDPAKPGLSRSQRQFVLEKMAAAVSALAATNQSTAGGTVDLTQWFGSGSSKIPAWVVCQGGACYPIYKFEGPDGDRKQVFMKLSGSPPNPTVSLMWEHDPSFIEAVIAGLPGVQSGLDAACKLLPMATKVPNPYVAAGSLILQMSGQCQTCPPGMLADQDAKTCSCPPGTVLNASTQQCEAPGSNWLMIALLGGAGLLGLYVATR